MKCLHHGLYILFSDHSGNKVTFRSCSVARSESVDPCAMTDSMSNLLKGQGKVEFCETCENDLCNGSSRHSVTIMSALLVPCFAIIISRWVGVWTNSMTSPSLNNIFGALYWILHLTTLNFDYVLYLWATARWISNGIHYLIDWIWVHHWQQYFRWRSSPADAVYLISYKNADTIILVFWNSTHERV